MHGERIAAVVRCSSLNGPVLPFSKSSIRFFLPLGRRRAGNQKTRHQRAAVAATRHVVCVLGRHRHAVGNALPLD